MARETKAEKIERMTSDPEIREAMATGKDQHDKDVQAALSHGKELPSGTVLNFYGRRADIAASGDSATGNDGNEQV